MYCIIKKLYNTSGIIVKNIIMLKNSKIINKIILSKKLKKGSFKKILNNIEYYKINTILRNKNNIVKNLKDLNFYVNYYFKYKKKIKNLNLLNLFIILKKIKKIFSFLIFSFQNFNIIQYMSYIKPGLFTNKKKKKKLFPNIILFFNLQFKNKINQITQIKKMNKILKKNNKKTLDNIQNNLTKPSLEFYNLNELYKLKIFTIIFNLNFKFYQLLNKFDIFLPINLKNTEEILFKKLFNTCLKFSKISKILYVIYKQFFYLKIKSKLNNKYTHYWTRTNTFKIKNRF